MMHRRYSGTGCALLFGLLGCGRVDTGSIKTSGMTADLTASATGDGNTRVRAALRVGGAFSTTFVDLQAGDSFTATVGGTTQTLSRTQEIILAAVSYTSTFAGDDAVPVSIALTRANDVSAPSSTTMLPASFTLTAPMANATISRGSSFVITWTPAGNPSEPMDISLSGGNCLQSLSKSSQPDNGQLTINAGELKAASGMQQATCPVAITATRTRSGTVDKAYDGGGISASQLRITSISSTP